MLALSGTLLVTLLATSSPAAAAKDLRCRGTVTGVNVRSVNVPAGAACKLVDSTVRRNVKVRAGSYFQATSSRIRGHVKSRNAQTIFLDRSRVRKNVIARGTAEVFLFDSTIRGKVHVSGASDRVYVCGNTVRRDIEVMRNRRNILVGDPLAVDCKGNVVQLGSIEIESNSTDVELVVRGNTIRHGDLEVIGNVGPVEKFIQNNRGGRGLKCRSNGSPFVASGNTGWGTIAGQCKST